MLPLIDKSLIGFFFLLFFFFFFFFFSLFHSNSNSKLTSMIKIRETTKASLLECVLSIFQARYAACPPLGGNRRVSINELCVLSPFLFYARPGVNRNPMMKHQLRYHRPIRLSHCRQIMIDILLIIMLVPISN